MVVTEKLGKKYRKEKEVSATCTNDAEGLGTREETKINGRNTRRKTETEKGDSTTCANDAKGSGTLEETENQW